MITKFGLDRKWFKNEKNYVNKQSLKSTDLKAILLKNLKIRSIKPISKTSKKTIKCMGIKRLGIYLIKPQKVHIKLEILKNLIKSKTNK